MAAPEDHKVHESLAAQLRLWVKPGHFTRLVDKQETSGSFTFAKSVF